MAILRYEFTNFTEDAFTGRFGGIDYTFAPGETRSFDPDKHYMLLLLAKQLADRELVRRIKSVGRDPKDMERWGKSLDANGQPFVITADMRKIIMRDAIGVLADTPVPTPDHETDEAGATKETTADVKTLQDEVRELKELVGSLTSALSQTTQPRMNVSTDRVSSPVNSDSSVVEPNTNGLGLTREVLEEMASDAGITKTETMTKEELIRAVNQTQAQV